MAATLTLFPLFTLAFFAGCEKRVESANIDVVNRQQKVAEKRPVALESVQQGLTMKEVEAVLGAPTQVHTGKVTRQVEKEFAFTTWVYQQDGQSIELSFVDGKLQGKVPQFGEKLEPTAPLQMKKAEKKAEAAEKAP